MKPNRVTIDGVEYAPITESVPTMRQIAEGIVAMWWGEVKGDERWLEDMMGCLRVNVNDQGDGEPIEDLLASIAKRLEK